MAPAFVGATVSSFASMAPDDDCATAVAWPLHRFLCAAAMMGSPSLRLKDVKAPKFINKKRIARGEEPINTYVVVTINTDRVRQDTARLGTHASPRLHWRRGHKRRLPDGHTTWVRPCLVGTPSRGSCRTTTSWSADGRG
jgi:hypothetical protein